MKTYSSCLVAASMMLASTIASAGAVYKCASGSGSFVYQDQPCPGGSALVAPISTGSTTGAAANRQVSPLCLKQVATKPAQSMALQLERVRVHSRMKVFSMSMAAPAPDDDAVKRGKCEDIVTRYDSLLTELNHSDLDDLKKLGQCFISQSYLLHAEQAKLSCGLGG